MADQEVNDQDVVDDPKDAAAFSLEIAELRDLMELRGREAVGVIADTYGGIIKICERLHTSINKGWYTWLTSLNVLKVLRLIIFQHLGKQHLDEKIVKIQQLHYNNRNYYRKTIRRLVMWQFVYVNLLHMLPNVLVTATVQRCHAYTGTISVVT